MESRDIETAAEFCKLVGKTSLLDYLSLEGGIATPDEAREQLKARRKYLQGMQSNPKFKAEALSLIKSYATLDRVLSDLEVYRKHLNLAQESENLPIVEMTIRTMLRGGQASADQITFLETQAKSLGVSGYTFRELLARLTIEANFAPNPLESIEPAYDEDFYQLLGVSPFASRDDVYNAYRQRHEEARALSDRGAATRLLVRLDKAWKILGDATQRNMYDMSRTRTGPPARSRDFGDHATAPPARFRDDSTPFATPPPVTLPPTGRRGTAGPMARMDVIGSTNREVELHGPGAVEESILVRNVGEGPMPGRVSSDAPWLTVSPAVLDAKRTEQVILVRADPQQAVGARPTAVVSIATTHGERATVQFTLIRPSSKPPYVVGGIALAVFLVALAVVATKFSASPPPVHPQEVSA